MNRKLWIAAGAAAVLIVAFFVLRPSRYERVKNLDSKGSAIIAFGDSITAGFGAAKGEDYPSKLSALANATIVNAGVSGDTTDSALERIESDVLTQNPRIVIVGLGGNDFLRGASMQSTETNLRTIIRKVHDSGAMVVLLGFKFPSFSNYGTMYERVADEEGCLFVPEVLDGILTDPALKSDEIHPNARGYALVAERVAGPLRKLIRAAG